MRKPSEHPRRPSESLPLGQRFHQLKMSLRRKLARDFGHDVPLSLVRRALDEAEQTALASGFPHLFFPELAAEQLRLVALALGGGSLSHRERLADASVCAA